MVYVYLRQPRGHYRKVDPASLPLKRRNLKLVRHLRLLPECLNLEDVVFVSQKVTVEAAHRGRSVPTFPQRATIDYYVREAMKTEHPIVALWFTQVSSYEHKEGVIHTIYSDLVIENYFRPVK